ncbi:MAG: hypothetical protein ACLQVJ_22680 [Syntrophobacteraceae bacterium]
MDLQAVQVTCALSGIGGLLKGLLCRTGRLIGGLVIKHKWGLQFHKSRQIHPSVLKREFYRAILGFQRCSVSDPASFASWVD